MEALFDVVSISMSISLEFSFCGFLKHINNTLKNVCLRSFAKFKILNTTPPSWKTQNLCIGQYCSFQKFNW